MSAEITPQRYVVAIVSTGPRPGHGFVMMRCCGCASLLLEGHEPLHDAWHQNLTNLVVRLGEEGRDVRAQLRKLTDDPPRRRPRPTSTEENDRHGR